VLGDARAHHAILAKTAVDADDVTKAKLREPRNRSSWSGLHPQSWLAEAKSFGEKTNDAAADRKVESMKRDCFIV
jgi:hypothetical protein